MEMSGVGVLALKAFRNMVDVTELASKTAILRMPMNILVEIKKNISLYFELITWLHSTPIHHYQYFMSNSMPLPISSKTSLTNSKFSSIHTSISS